MDKLSTKSNNKEETDNLDVKNAFKIFKLHFPWMLDRIPINYKHLRDNYWNIKCVMEQYWELFYYNSDIFDDDMIKKTEEIQEKYSGLLSENFTCKSNLYKILMMSTITKNNKMRIDSNKKSLVKDLIRDDEYDFLSPVFILEIYKNKLKIKSEDREKYVRLKLDKHVEKINTRCKKFKYELILICRKYILHMPVKITDIKKYQYSHVKNMHNCILSVCEDLIDLKVITFNYLIDDFIMEKLDLFEIIIYDPEQNENKKILMI